MGTRLVTNNTANLSYEQANLPFGTALNAESTGATNQRFTSYDRSTVSGLDYAVNRSYSAAQGRFTSVDPIGMSATSLANPQSMNLYAYVQNNPIDNIDPSGLLMAIPWSGYSNSWWSNEDWSGFMGSWTVNVYASDTDPWDEEWENYWGANNSGISTNVSYRDRIDVSIDNLPSSLLDDKVKKQDHPDKSALEAALKDRLAEGDCGQKLSQLLKKLGSKSKTIGEVAENFFNGNYSLLQTVETVPLVAVSVGGKTITTFVAGETSYNGKTIVINKGITAINNLIHELIHASGAEKGGAYSEKKVNDAIQKLEEKGGAKSINTFLGKHCKKKSS